MILPLVLVLAAAPDSYVIVVGNNQSPMLGRPQLAYADDDAVRAAEVFETLLAPSRVELLTELDSDTRRVFPEVELKAQPPRKDAVVAAFGRLAAWASTQRALGHRTRGYFVFAGHGDIANGEGFLELQDGRLTGSELETLLKSAGADELHVVLDSCNSWFVLSPRKPGGRRFPTPNEATQTLAKRLPNVGVLLSTSAEAEVYEWSELQSGIFSYALRSGLMGAADANGDADITYDELAAFIDAATRSVKNPNLRPHIFSRAPGGGVRGAFASLEGARGVHLTILSDDPLRLRFRDSAGLRWFDASLAAGASTLRLPSRLAEGVVERRVDSGWVGLAFPAGETRVQLASLRSATELTTARGVTDALQTLFTEPFGADTVNAWREADAARADTAPIGVSSAMVSRVGFLLDLAAKRDGSQRRAGAAMGASLGVVGAVGYGIAAGMSNDSTLKPSFIGAAIGSGLGGVLVGGSLLFRTEWEKQAERFEELSAQGQAAEAVQALDGFLEKRRRYYVQNRLLSQITSGVLCLVGVGSVVLGLFLPSGDSQAFLIGIGSAAAGLGTGFLVSTFWSRLPEEDLYEALREERRVSEVPLSFSITPTANGAVLGLSGRF